MSDPLTCSDSSRRDAARGKGFNGIEGVNVSPDQLSLSVLLMGNAPHDLSAANFVIEGGVRVTDIHVVDVGTCDDGDPGLADCLQLTVDKCGDHSTYRLCIVESGSAGMPGRAPYPGFDPRYACAEFTFKQNCPNLLDCAPDEACSPEPTPSPEIDYLAKDYASFRQLLLDRLSLTMPQWTERHIPDVGVTLVELLAYHADRLSYKQDATAAEAYLQTARRRVSVRRHARLVDYAMHDGCAARAWVCVETTEELTLKAFDYRFVALPPGVPNGGRTSLLAADLDETTTERYETFEPVRAEEVSLRPAHNVIELWAWGSEECCLPRGATSATLVDPGRTGSEGAPALDLEPGDVLILRERIGPRTGLEADADPSHVQAVRLTRVTRATDEVFGQSVLEVTWSREDALGFELCVRSRGGPACDVQQVGVAHGNVVLVEHGRSNRWCGHDAETEDLPPARPGPRGCPDCAFGCRCQGQSVVGQPYPPERSRTDLRLDHAPITQTSPFPVPAVVARAQATDLRGLPRRTRQHLYEMLRAVEGGASLSQADRDELTTLFGRRLLHHLRLAHDPQHALYAVVSRFDDYLADKIDRVTDLVRRAQAGYVLADQDEGWEIGQSWGERERRRLDPDRSEFRGSAASALRTDPRMALPAVTATIAGDSGGEWTPRRDLMSSGPGDHHFVGETDDDGVTTLRFGDGRQGADVPAGSKFQISYRVGNGKVGNVGRRAINRIVFCSTRTNAIVAVWNPLPAVGGTDPEPVADVRRAAPSEMLRRLLRAITADDYATLAGLVPGVQRAAAEVRWNGSWNEVRVAVDPSGEQESPDWLLSAVRRSLHASTRIGHDLSVSSAQLVPLDLAISVQVHPDHVAGHVRAAVLRQLGAGVLPDGRRGFFHPDNLTFGTPVRVSQIVAAVAAVPGVRHAEVTRLQPLFGPAGDALSTGRLRLAAREVAQLDNDPSRPDNGMLTLDVGGGR
jgi:predicted phage baseplate assembly protein